MALPADLAERPVRRSVGLLTSALIAACAVVTIERVAEDALRTPYFLTGWVLFAVTIGFVLSVHLPPAPSGTALARRLGYHADATLFLVVLVGAHVQWRAVTGWLDLCLALISVAFTLSVAGGWQAARKGGERAERAELERWFRRQGLWTHALLGAGLAHGLFMHGHGALAHLVLGK